MQSNDHEQELSRYREEIAEIIIRGYEYSIGKPTIVAQVMSLGYTRETAIQLVDSYELVLLRGVEKAENESRSKKDFIWGFSILFVGGAISLTTFLAASEAGGTYIVTSPAFGEGGFSCCVACSDSSEAH